MATWVSQSSLDTATPLALAGLAPNHYTTELVAASNAFCLHLIASDRIDLAWRFGIGSGRHSDKFAGLPNLPTQTGSPKLPGCLGWLDCRVVERDDAGDRIYFWAEVVAGKHESIGQPLMESELLAAASDDQRAALRARMQADIEIHRSLRAAWRSRLIAATGDSGRDRLRGVAGE